MLMADDSANLWSFGDSLPDDDDDDFGPSMDIESILSILSEETPDTQQNSSEDLSLGTVHQGLRLSEGVPLFGDQTLGTVNTSYNSDATDFRRGVFDGSLESVGNSLLDHDTCKLEPSSQIGSPVNSCSGSLADWIMPFAGHDTVSAERDGSSHNALSHSRNGSKEIQHDIHNSSVAFSFAAGDVNHASDSGANLNLNYTKDDSAFPFRNLEGEMPCEDAFGNLSMGNSDMSCATYCDLSRLKTSGAPDLVEASIMDVNIPSPNAYYTHFDSRGPDILYENDIHFPALQYCINSETTFLGPAREIMPNSFNLEHASRNDGMTINLKDEVELLHTKSACLDSASVFEDKEGRGRTGYEASTSGNSSVWGCNIKCEGINILPSMGGNYSAKMDDGFTFETASLQHMPYAESNSKEISGIKDEGNDELFAAQSMLTHSFYRESSRYGERFSSDKNFGQLLSCNLSSMSSEEHVVHLKNEDVSVSANGACQSLNTIDETARRNLVADGQFLDIPPSDKSSVPPSTLTEKQLGCKKDEMECIVTHVRSVGSKIATIIHQKNQSNISSVSSHVDDDPDICILEDISEPPASSLYPLHAKALVPAKRTNLESLHHIGVGGVRPKTNDERLIFRAALQRIALSWMVQKETASLHCSGGILADDQGLGKTISTIALILKERSPSSRQSPINVKGNEIETLNLDEDEEDVSELGGSNQDGVSCQIRSNGSSLNHQNTSLQGKGRLAAGTLVVCPTSVLRQWAEELHNKVSSNANLSVLVYHGSNRTKDPFELAKYDVVLTTYAIVSMEVPKQPLVDKDDDETVKRERQPVPCMGLSSSKKRKYPPSSDKRSKKGLDSALLESAARPLARVGWFRVVLDEAQSIKNHRTQVARACWGLRAKRRWCLSGTPIQNAVDDLYSYFRFLRYDPYAVYKSFCSTIKVPINRNPSNGYRKLQAVLKTIMLRRTKGTLLDGKPIINLPPKLIELRKVDFTDEERDFYCRLEADSRAQFAEYAAAGTVKQNYVNILLMLLRLRQACDHPLLVRGYDSGSQWRSSVEMAKKLPQERLVCLLNCLEASLAICGICNDPPEDAVATSCGHVFCNQCISEHLTGDDNQCPAANCKAQLSKSLVFSRATLKSALLNQPGQDATPDCSGVGNAEVVEPYSASCASDSSKIKAALEVLQSLSKPRDGTLKSSLNSIDESASCPGKSYDPHLVGPLRDKHEKKCLDLDKDLNVSVKRVGEKAIVFSQWTRMLDLLEVCLKNSSIQYRRLDGTMSVVARDKAVKDFNTLPEVTVMIMSLKAASLGLNMVAACHVLLLDLWWNPTTEDQAIDRAHRIGQTRPVTVLRLTVKDTVEDRILALQLKKREMVASAFGEDETGSRETRLTVEDLKYLFMA